MRTLLQIAGIATLGLLGVVALRARQSQSMASGLHPSDTIVQPAVLSKNALFSQDHTSDIVAIESVWSAYVYYNDSHNGPGIASLFTDDAVIHFVWNQGGTLIPTFGINPTQTPDGVKGEGCTLRGRKDFIQYYGYNRDVNDQPLALPGQSHHVYVNEMVKVSDDGKTAMLTTAHFGASSIGGPAKVGGTGSYRVYFRKTPNEGWEIADMYGISDKPSATTNCDMKGPLPRPRDAVATTQPTDPKAVAQLISSQANHPSQDIAQQPVLSKDELFSQDHTSDIVAIESVWSAYVYYNDSHNGPGAASLFTDDSVIHFVWNQRGTLVPTFGINPYQTPDGMNGGGCVLSGHPDIAQYFGYNRTGNLPAAYHDGLPLPGPSHHVSTNKMVKVNEDGKAAMLTAVWVTAGGRGRGGEGASEQGGAAGGGINGTGSYRIFLRKTASDGWQIASMYGISDRPSAGNTACDLHGPLPRPQTGQ
jgi:SnoaL-like domain